MEHSCLICILTDSVRCEWLCKLWNLKRLMSAFRVRIHWDEILETMQPTCAPALAWPSDRVPKVWVRRCRKDWPALCETGGAAACKVCMISAVAVPAEWHLSAKRLCKKAQVSLHMSMQMQHFLADNSISHQKHHKVGAHWCPRLPNKMWSLSDVKSYIFKVLGYASTCSSKSMHATLCSGGERHQITYQKGISASPWQWSAS